MTEPSKRALAGLGQPQCLRSVCDDKIESTTKAVRSACRSLIEAQTRPSIAKVAELSCRHMSTVNREPYKSILDLERRRYVLVAAGMALESALALSDEDLREPAQSTAPVAPADPVLAAALVKMARLEARLARRDVQLYDALGLVQSLRATVRWHRIERSALLTKLAALANEPLPPRRARKWREDFDCTPTIGSDDDDDNDDDDDVR